MQYLCIIKLVYFQNTNTYPYNFQSLLNLQLISLSVVFAYKNIQKKNTLSPDDSKSLKLTFFFIICNIFSGVRYKKKNEGGLDSGTLDNTY